jgi:hypothetical protein
MLLNADVNVTLNQARVELTGVSDAGLKAALFEVLDEIFRDSRCWHEEITINVAPPATQPTTPVAVAQALTYPLAVTEGQIIALKGVRNANGSFVAAVMPKVGELRLQCAPNQAQQYFVVVDKTVSLPLTRDNLPIAPDWILQKWHLVVKAGLLGTMMNQKNKSYSDSKGAAYWLSKFRGGIQEIRSATLRANTDGAGVWRFPQSFQSRSQKGGVPVYSTGNDWSG